MATVSPRFAVALLVALIFAVGTAESSSRSAFPDDDWPEPPVLSQNAWVSIKSYRLKYNYFLNVARFAVTSYNNERPGELPLKLVSMDDGEILAAGSGTVNHLYLTASSHAHSEKKYQAFVFVDPESRSRTRQLLLFVPLHTEN